MSGQFIVFRNSGTIDPTSIKTFGVSVKEGENPIGYFGTGLKYAIAIMMRLNHEVTVISGLNVYKFGKVKKSIRGKEFDIVTMNGEEMPFSTELGKNWEPWQAFREIYCNCIDEKGEVTATDMIPLAEEDTTYVIIKGREATLSYLDRHSIVLSIQPDLLVKSGGMEIYNSPNKFLYYRGVRVHQLTKPSMFTYNIIEDTELTEDRTLKYYNHVASRIPLHIAGINDKHVLKRILYAEDACYEHWLSFDWLDWNQEFIGKEIIQVLDEAYEANSDKANKSAMKFYRKKKDKDAAKNYKEEEPTRVERMQLDRCMAILRSLYHDFDDWKVMVVKSLGSTTMAVADTDRGLIVVSKDCFRLGTKYLLSTLIEEYAHLKSGHSDCTTAFQTYIFDMLSTLIEEHVIKEPV